MLILGLQGSPRNKGNTSYLLSAFLKEAEKYGVRTRIINVCEKNIVPCKEYVVCEKKGFCPIDDDMKHEIYFLLREADIIVMATPIFFYNATAQLKALIDRSQTLWARRYKLKLKDPKHHFRRGFLLSVAATQGKQLFEGLHLTTKYFFDAVGASYAGSLTYRGIEHKGDMEKHSTVLNDIEDAVKTLITPFSGRKKVVFACRENACRSQMASAFAQIHGWNKIDVFSAGSNPAERINPVMIDVMQEKGIDMGFRKPKSLAEVLEASSPDMIITMGCGEECPFIPGTEIRDWQIPDPANQSAEFMRNVRDEIEKNVVSLIQELLDCDLSQ